MPHSLNIRLPDDVQARLDAIRDDLVKRTGGIEMPFSKVVLHVIRAGLEVVEAETVKSNPVAGPEVDDGE